MESVADKGGGDSVVSSGNIAAVVGWREYVELPDWGVSGVLAKIDTGARTSALHVEDISLVGENRVRFRVVLSLKDDSRRVPVEAEIVRKVSVRSSFGGSQERYVVATRLRLGPVEKPIELGLVCRKRMLCRMLLGRASLEGRFLVDPSRRYTLGRPRRGRRRPKPVPS
jgi:hypothetical protein